MGECGGKWDTKIMLINGGAVCCLDGDLDSAAPSDASESLQTLLDKPQYNSHPLGNPYISAADWGLRKPFNPYIILGVWCVGRVKVQISSHMR